MFLPWSLLRHADLLLVIGPVSRNMEMALRRTPVVGA